MNEFNYKLDLLKEKIKQKGLETVKNNVVVYRIFSRIDGFEKIEEIKYKRLTLEEFSFLTRREWHIYLPKKIDVCKVDLPTPSYLENNILIFYPQRCKWDKNKLYIYYEEK
jgi:hypothetical protein